VSLIRRRILSAGEEIVHSRRKRRGRVNPLVVGSNPTGPKLERVEIQALHGAAPRAPVACDRPAQARLSLRASLQVGAGRWACRMREPAQGVPIRSRLR